MSGKSGGVCMFCGQNGAHRSCGHCEAAFHIACARQVGHLTLHGERDAVSGSTMLDYHWECPNCENSVRGKM